MDTHSNHFRICHLFSSGNIEISYRTCPRGAQDGLYSPGESHRGIGHGWPKIVILVASFQCKKNFRALVQIRRFQNHHSNTNKFSVTQISFFNTLQGVPIYKRSFYLFVHVKICPIPWFGGGDCLFVFVLFFSYAKWLVRSQFLDQGLSLGPCIESTKVMQGRKKHFPLPITFSDWGPVNQTKHRLTRKTKLNLIVYICTQIGSEPSCKVYPSGRDVDSGGC